MDEKERILDPFTNARIKNEASAPCGALLRFQNLLFCLVSVTTNVLPAQDRQPRSQHRMCEYPCSSEFSLGVLLQFYSLLYKLWRFAARSRMAISKPRFETRSACTRILRQAQYRFHGADGREAFRHFTEATVLSVCSVYKKGRRRNREGLHYSAFARLLLIR